jgi:hypothetical protein
LSDVNLGYIGVVLTGGSLSITLECGLIGLTF